jgi:hypothetical protein
MSWPARLPANYTPRVHIFRDTGATQSRAFRAVMEHAAMVIASAARSWAEVGAVTFWEVEVEVHRRLLPNDMQLQEP